MYRFSQHIARVPVIETERLRLRAHTYDDFAPCAAMWADPAVTRFIGGTPSTQQQTWSRLLAYAGLWSLLDFGYWAIADRESDRYLGDIGFADFNRDIDASMRGVPELGYTLASHVHERGYASEAIRAVLAWGDEHLKSRRTVCLIDPQNAASRRVAERVGYAVFQEGSFGGKPALFLERTAS